MHLSYVNACLCHYRTPKSFNEQYPILVVIRKLGSNLQFLNIKMYDIVKCVLCNYVGLAPQILFSISHIPLALKKIFLHDEHVLY